MKWQHLVFTASGPWIKDVVSKLKFIGNGWSAFTFLYTSDDLFNLTEMSCCHKKKDPRQIRIWLAIF